MPRLSPHLVFLPLVGVILSQMAMAQCANQWQSTGGFRGVGTGYPPTAIRLWDPDGAGPQTEVLVAAGSFAVAGDSVAPGIAAWDPASGAWSAIGAGLARTVVGPPVPNALATLPNGDLCVAGTFELAGGVSVNHIARWNGSAWASLGGGTDGNVRALAVLANGDLVAAGSFTQAGGVAASGIARWNGSSWSSIGGISGSITCLAVLSNGDLVVGGQQLLLGGTTSVRIARWNGVTWAALGGDVDGAVGSFATMPNGDLVVGGAFTHAGGTPANVIARWSGTSWSAMPGLLVPGSTAFRLTVLPGGQLVAVGQFSLAGGISASCVAWTGVTWVPYTTPQPTSVTTVSGLPNGDLIVAGYFVTVGGIAADGVARWDGSNWSALGSAAPTWDNTVQSFLRLPSGGLVAGGYFTVAGGVPCQHVAQRVGAAWAPMGGGTNGPVYSLASLPNGEVLAADGSSSLQRWDGVMWSPFGAPFFSASHAVLWVAVAGNGDVYAIGATGTPFSPWPNAIYTLARWTGSAWSAVGSPSGTTMLALSRTVHGDVHVAYYNASTGSPATVGRIVGSTLTTVGQFDDQVTDLVELADGSLIACGSFAHVTDGSAVVAASRIARWDGASWSAPTPDPGLAVRTVTELPNGDLVAGGFVTPLQGGVTRWDGASWTLLGTATDNQVTDIAFDGEGTLLASGAFSAFGGVASPFVARLATNCAATSSTYAPGCPSSAGNAQWQVTSGPWIGGTYRTTCSNLPPLSVAVEVIGLGVQPFSLDAVFAEGVPGCSVVPTLDLLGLRAVVAGRVETEILVPNQPFAGVPFWHQLVPFEFTVGGPVFAVTATDTLQLTFGSF